MLQHFHETVTIVRVLKTLLCLTLMMTTLWLSPPSWWWLDKLDLHHYSFRMNRSPQDAMSNDPHSIFTHPENKNSYISMPLVDFTQQSTQSHPWGWLEHFTLQAWIKHSVTGYLTSSQTEPLLCVSVQHWWPPGLCAQPPPVRNTSDSSYCEEMLNVAECCTVNNLLLNISKTNEMIVDLRKKSTKNTPPHLHQWSWHRADEQF